MVLKTSVRVVLLEELLWVLASKLYDRKDGIVFSINVFFMKNLKETNEENVFTYEARDPVGLANLALSVSRTFWGKIKCLRQQITGT